MATPPFQRINLVTPATFSARLRELELLDPVGRGLTYWATEAAYVIDAAMANQLLEAAAAIHKRCEEAAMRLVGSGDYDRFAIASAGMREAIAKSWRAKESPLYGRMDFSFDAEGTPMLLDYESEPLFGLCEASYLQWEWFEALQAATGLHEDNQENLIHEGFTALIPKLNLPSSFAVACGGPVDSNGRPADSNERFDAEYLSELCRAAGLQPRICSIQAIGWDRDAKAFVDDRDEVLAAMLKIYPWDWMEDETNVEVLPASRTRILPAAWTRLLGDKTMMALLWHMFPVAPNLLPTFLERPSDAGPMVAKPRRGWDGEHVFLPGQPIAPVPEAEVGPLLHQAHCPLPVFETDEGPVHAAVSVWMVGGAPAGLSFRESHGPVTGIDARFVPHILRG